INGLPEDVVGTVTIRGKEHRFAIGRPVVREVLSLIESKQARCAQSCPVLLNVSDVHVAFQSFSQESQPLSIRSKAQTANPTSVARHAYRRTLELSSPLVDPRRPQVVIALAWRSLLQ